MPPPSDASVQATVQQSALLPLWRQPTFWLNLTIGWNFLFIIGSLGVSLSVFSMDNFFNLGDPVKIFAGIVLLLPAIIGIYSSYQLYYRNNQGRFAAFGLNYTVATLAFCYLLHLWGLFIGFDDIANAIYENTGWLIGFAIGYFFFWLAGKFDETSRTGLVIERSGLVIALLALAGLLWFGGGLDAFGHILGTYGELHTWLVTLLALGSGLVGYRVLLLGDYLGEHPEGRVAWQGWLMLSPNMIGFALFFAGPLLLSLYLSFTDAAPGREPNVTFFDNYGKIFQFEFRINDHPDKPAQSVLQYSTQLSVIQLWGDQRLVIGTKDRFFWIGMWNTIRYCFLLVPLSVIPALGLSVLLNSKLPGVKFYRALYFLPSVAAVVGIAIIWRDALYSSTTGYLNYVITETVTSLNDTLGTNIKDPKIVWLSEAPLLSLVLMSAWQIVGFNTVIFLAGLQGIPKDLYEAASVDGANKWQQFHRITLPMLAPTTFFVVVTTIINGLQVFNEPWVLFGDEIPEGATTVVVQLYNNMFRESEFGYASAVAWVLFVVIFAVTLLQFRISRSNAYD